ncbi:MAG TPA: hypothetical protein DDZ89_00910 [Clostridiales bacterium]|nr:hypothetical protein [Clostridiales bacterium]
MINFIIVMIMVEWLIDGFLTAKYHRQRKRIELLEKHICYLYGMIDGVPAPDFLPEIMDCNNCTDKGYCPDCPRMKG